MPIRPVPAIPPGIQLYTMRSLLARDLEGTLLALGALGYGEVEPAGLHGRTPSAFRAALDRAGLRAPSGHIGLDRLSPARLTEVMDEAHELGHEHVIVPWVNPKEFARVDDWRRLAGTLASIGERFRTGGLGLGYHNHGFETRPLPDGTVPYDLLLRVDPALLVMQMDVFWMIEGGADPVAYLSAHPGRFVSLHAKDRGADGKQTVVGRGLVDFTAILSQASEAGIRHVYAEQDDPADPLAFARDSISYLRTLRPR